MRIYIDEGSGSVYEVKNMGDYGDVLLQYPINADNTCELENGIEVEFDMIGEEERECCLSIKRILMSK